MSGKERERESARMKRRKDREMSNQTHFPRCIYVRSVKRFLAGFHSDRTLETAGKKRAGVTEFNTWESEGESVKQETWMKTGPSNRTVCTPVGLGSFLVDAGRPFHKVRS